MPLASHQPSEHAAEFGRQQRAAARVVLQLIDEARTRGIAQDQRGPRRGFVLIQIGRDGAAAQDALHRARGLPRLMRRHVYEPYVAELAVAEAEAAQLLGHDRSESVRKLSVRNRADQMLNVLRRTREMAFRGVDVITRRANAAPVRSSR